jgi:tripartite ATP-independent transporter DctP family solute receptor
MTMLSRIRTLTAGCAVLALAAAFAGSADAKVSLRLTMSSDDTHPNTIAVREMVEKIKQRSNGDIEIQVFSNNALGAPPETTEQTRLGVIDLAILSPSQLDKFNRAFGVVMIPYQFDDYQHAYKTLGQTAWDWFQKKANEVGFEIVANFEWGFRALSNSKQAVNKPDDVKGLKIRVPPEIQIKASMEALGAVTQTIAFPEVYMALANKVVDGQDNPIPTIYSQKFYEVQKHVALTKHVYNHMLLAANKNVWATKLNDAQRKILKEEAVAYGNKARKLVQEQDDYYVGEMKKAGVSFTSPNVAEFRPKMGPAYDAIKKFVGEQNWDEWQKLVDAARK